jgi:hypothetical protein
MHGSLILYLFLPKASSYHSLLADYEIWIGTTGRRDRPLTISADTSH